MNTGVFDLAGRLIAVTGGAGHLGSALCQGLADAGAHVLCLSSRLHHFRQPIHPEGVVTSRICDVANEAEFDEMIGRKFAAIHHDRLDGLVTCAGRAPRGVDLDSASDFTAGLKTLETTTICCRVALRYLSNGASVVNVASMWGLVSPDPKVYLDLGNEPGLATPSAAAGILQLTKYLAVLAAGKQVRVNALVPGWFPRNRGTPRPDYMRQIESRVPLGRIGQPEELVGPAIFLLSSASSYMTGQALTIDGGYTLR